MAVRTRYPVVVLEKIPTADCPPAFKTAENDNKVGSVISEVVLKKDSVSQTSPKAASKDQTDFIPLSVKPEMGGALSANGSHCSGELCTLDLVAKMKKEPREITHELVRCLNSSSSGSQNSQLLIKCEDNHYQEREVCFDVNASSVFATNRSHIRIKEPLRESQSKVYYDASNIKLVDVSVQLENLCPKKIERLKKAQLRKDFSLRTNRQRKSRNGSNKKCLAKNFKAKKSLSNFDSIGGSRAQSRKVGCKKGENLNERSNEKKHKCTQCPAKFKLAGDLNRHLLIHTGEKPFKCSHCSRTFRYKSARTTHLRVHTGEKPFKCSQCPKTFRQTSSLIAHSRVHSGERPYKCNQCLAAFTQSSGLKTHIKVRHLKVSESEKRFVCSQCPKRFYRSAGLTEHMLIHREDKPFECKECHAKFNWKSNFTLHVKVVHSREEKQFKCDLCSKTFRQRTTLINHLRIHSNERPYACTQCPAKFKQSVGLSEHVEIHSDVRAYKCEQCPASFKQRRCLRNHMILHREEKPFKCRKCPARFNQRYHLKSHLASHADKTALACAHCPFKCKQKEALRRHLIMHTASESR